MNLFIGYPKCSTCKKAEKFLIDNNVNYEYKNIKEDTPSKYELEKIINDSKKDIKKFFNTSGLVYRNMNLKDKLDDMSYDEKIELLASNGMLIKRPILVSKDKVIIGFNQKEYEKII